MNSLQQRLRNGLSGFLATWLICTPAWADDTEIYFGGSTNVTVQPNVLFILDTSGSMTSTDGGSTTRLDRMKSALTDILNNVQDVNVGLMRFTNPGGPILYPVSDIDAAVTTTVQEDALTGTTSSVISEGDDDAEQAGDGSVSLASTTLEMTTGTVATSTSVSTRVASDNDDAEERVYNGSIYRDSTDLELMDGDGNEQIIGLRFANLNVPAGATITSAWLEFEVDEQNTASADPITVLISAEASDNASSFGTTAYNISGRSKTAANTTWAITSNPGVDSALTTPGIGALVQEVVDRGGWAANNAIAFVIEKVSGSGIRWVESYKGEASAAPQLHVVYTTLTTTTVTAQISDGNDDASEASGGKMTRTSQDLELVNSGERIGLRFASVNIPTGATITDARLIFEIDEENAASANMVTLRISGEDADAPVTYGNSSNDISSRPTTSANTSWAINSNPAVNNALTSPNINNVVQEIVDRTGWAANNPMAFILEQVSGSGIRWVESYNGESAAAAQLQVTYTTGSGTPSAQTIGLRFNTINIPQGATVTSASVTFTADNSDSGTTNLVFYGEDADHSAGFTSAANNLSAASRPRTTANVGWNAAGTLGPWNAGSEYQSPDLTSVIQEIVSRTGWCGGNSLSLIVTGTGLRIAKSYENDPSQAPRLDITYDPASNPNGCMNHEFGVRVNSSSDDAEQSSSGAVNLTSTDLELVNDGGDQTIGIRFNNVQLNQGTSVARAHLELAVDETTPTEATSLTIRAEDTGNSATFTTSANNIGGRTTTTANTNWSITDQWTVEHDLKQSPDISALVNEVLARGDWVPGNSMSFIITGSGKRVVESYDGSNLAPRLVYYTNPSNVPVTSNTVRSKLIEVVNSLDHKSGTPIVDALYEAALYYRGEAVDYGKTRGAGSDSEQADTRVSHDESYTGGVLVRPAGCTDDNLGSSACADEEITGTPIYTSPISESCQSNHIVLLTDGYASVNTSAAKVQAMTGDASCVDTGSSACGPELTYYLKNTDQLPSSMAQDQTITTHTIGFNFSDTWLHNLATQGGGGFYEASSATDLTDAFDTIIKTIKAVDSTFVEPSVTINQFNRFAHRDDVYFALFKPKETAKWLGNLKKYKLQGSPATLYDNSSPPKPAIDPTSGFFALDSKSYWSADEDGYKVESGGAASKLPTTRKVFTNVGAGSGLSATDNALSENNALITKALLNIPSATDAYRSDLLKWARGLDANGATRYELGDPLHSRPELITFAGNTDPIESTIFFGTNEGYLHAVDINTGIEQFAFVPKELLGNLDTYYSNQAVTPRPYGLDGGVTGWTKDVNGDGDLKDSGDFAYLYVGMRRGGRSYYALNITNTSAPSLLWQIDGGSGDFTDLGYTWSKPIKAKIMFDSVIREVLIFGGGYDPDQDNVTVRTTDNIGNAIYMVDAITGAKIWSAGNHNGHDENLAAMDYSIPSTIKVIDINRDGLVDQLYVGDMGGQIWRLDIDNTATQTQHLVSGAVIADLAGSDTASNRRFFYPPDISLAVEGKDRYLALAVGSGYRAHPLNTAIEDRFYMIKLEDVYQKPGSYPSYTESDLYDATDNLIMQGTDDQKSAAQVALSNSDSLRKHGWFIRLENSGEKVLASSLTILNQIVFTTYEPTAPSSGSCNPAQGTSRAYLVSLFDASPVEDVSGDGTTEKSDRVIQLQIGSIPSTPTVIDTLASKPTVWVGPERLDEVNTDVESVRTYWIEETSQ